MEKITPKLVAHIASLAKLEFDDHELEAITSDLTKIVQYVEKLNELDLEGVPETSHVLDLTNVFRQDKIEKSLDREEVQANAPARKKGYFSVPKVIE